VRGASAEPVDAVVVLGCRVERDGSPSPALARRIEHAHEGAAAGRAARIVASGGRRWWGEAEADVIRRVLLDRGVDPDTVFVEVRSNDTLENARFASALIRRLGGRRIAVATCDWHMPRAVSCFRTYGVAVEPWPARSPSPPWSRRLWRGVHEAIAWPLQRVRAVGDPGAPMRAETLR